MEPALLRKVNGSRTRGLIHPGTKDECLLAEIQPRSGGMRMMLDFDVVMVADGTAAKS